MMARLKWDLDPPSPHQLKKKRCQSWIPSDKTFWIRAWIMSVDSLISIEPVHTHCMHARIQNNLSEGVVREDRNALKMDQHLPISETPLSIMVHH